MTMRQSYTRIQMLNGQVRCNGSPSRMLDSRIVQQCIRKNTLSLKSISIIAAYHNNMSKENETFIQLAVLDTMDYEGNKDREITKDKSSILSAETI